VSLRLGRQRLHGAPKGGFRPLTDIGWYSSFWAEDPLWTNRPADGVAVNRWRNAGTLRTSGAHLTSDGLVLPGVAGNYASVPDADALDITGDITLVARVAMTDWTPGAATCVIGKWKSAGASEGSYIFRINPTGRVVIDWSEDGAAGLFSQSSTGTGFTDGTAGWIAATLDVDNGASGRTATFWTSTDGVTWTQLGSAVTSAGVTSIFNSTSVCEFGARGAGTTEPLAGTVSVARVYSGSGFTTAGPSGSLVLDADFTTTPGATSFTAATGQPVTVLSTFSANQATGSFQPTYRGSVATLNNRPAVDFDGTDDRLEILTGVSLAQPFSVVWIGSYDALTSARAVAGINSTSVNTRIGTNNVPNFSLNATSAINGGTPLVNTGYMQRAYVNGASSDVVVNGTSQVIGNAGASALDQIILGAGRTAPSTYANYFDGKTAFLGIFPGDITTHARWEDFKAWVRSHYGITVA